MSVSYPPVGFHFLVEFEIARGDSDIRFQEVSGLSVDIETEEVTEGGENRFVHKLPKRTKYPDLTLKRGLMLDSELLDWCKNAIETFEFEPSNIDITLLNEDHEGIITWNVINAVPKQWSVSSLSASENAIVVETLKLNYDYFRMIML